MLKFIDTPGWIVTTYVATAILYGASTDYASAQMPPGMHRPPPQVVVCASLTDVYDVAFKDMSTKKGADFSQLIKEGKCAVVPATLVDFYWYFDEYKDGGGTPGYISEVSYAGFHRHLFAIAATLPKLVEVTYKNEYAKNPPAISAWFIGRRRWRSFFPET